MSSASDPFSSIDNIDGRVFVKMKTQLTHTAGTYEILMQLTLFFVIMTVVHPGRAAAAGALTATQF